MQGQGGYFKHKRGSSADLIEIKKGYFPDKVRMVCHQLGETNEFSSVITKDTTELQLKADTSHAKGLLHFRLLQYFLWNA